MKRNALLLLFVSVIAAIVVNVTSEQAVSNNNGAPAGYTGSPWDNKTCAKSGCHPGPATAIASLITSDVPVSGYVPGTTYTVTANVSQTGINEFGFEISPQNSTGSLLGTIAITDATRTKFTGTGSKYVTHTTAGTVATSNANSWSFNWTAPVAGTGDVTFYGAFNYANSNNSVTGDQIHTSTLTIPEAIPAGIVSSASAATSFNLYPNPVNDQFHVVYYLQQPDFVAISLYDVQGKKIMDLLNENQQPGMQDQQLSLSNTIKSGVYVAQLRVGEQTWYRKFVKL